MAQLQKVVEIAMKRSLRNMVLNINYIYVVRDAGSVNIYV